MNQEEINNLLEIYEQGLSSSEEENILREKLGEDRKGSHPWFSYLNNKRINTPKHIEAQVWKSIQAHEKGKSRLGIKFISIAASIALLFSVLWITDPFKPREMSYEEKVAVLEEVQLMISASQKAELNNIIIYEDETIVIYTEK
jgi:hypothetical protein